MVYEVHIDQFNGPLDLLLHFIKDMKVDIHEVKVADIAEQYMNYIHEMEKLHLEIASEYLVMAAQLILIKSQTLLPKVKDPEEIDDYEENPEEMLKKRLIEYKRFKEVSQQMRDLEQERDKLIIKPSTDLADYFKMEFKPELDDDVEIYDIVGAFNKVLRRQLLRKPIPRKIHKRQITIEDRISDIRIICETEKIYSFTDLIGEYNYREYIVVTFLALLELVKEKELFVKQDIAHEEIYIAKELGDLYE